MDRSPRRRIARALPWIALALAGPAGAGAETWFQVDSPHFVVLSDAGEAQARHVAQRFERFRETMRQVRQDRVDPGRPIVILALKDERSLRQVLTRFWRQPRGARPAGVFVRGADKLYVVLRTNTTGANPYHVIYHEYVHLLNDLNYRHLPLWLDEGLAELYSTTEIGDDWVAWGQLSRRQMRRLRRSYLLPIETLFSVDRASPYYTDSGRAQIFYGHATALVHYLMFGAPGPRLRVSEFLALLQDGLDQTDAARRAFGDLGELETTLRSYLNFRSWQSGKRRAPAQFSREEIRVRTASLAEVSAVRGDLLVRLGDLREGRLQIEEALRRDPDLGIAHQAMGRLQLGLGRREEAVASFDKAVRCDPDSFLAHYCRASAAEPGSAASGAAGFRRAIELNPLFAPAHASLAALLAQSGGDLAEALALAGRACELEPNVTAYRLNLLGILSAAGLPEEARKVEQGLDRVAEGDVETLEEVATHYQARGRLDAAEQLLRRSLERRPDNPSVILLTGRLLAQQGRHGESEAVYRQALANPADERLRSADWSRVLEHLGDLLVLRGASQEAVDCWRRALRCRGLPVEIRDSLEAKLRAVTPGDERGGSR